jgi:hypothetical protein
MNRIPPFPPITIPPGRSVLVTLLGWLIIVLSILGLPISLISFLMLMANSYGTSTGGPLGWIIVLGGPILTLVAGIGLLRRKPWARLYLLLVAMGILVYNGYKMVYKPIPETIHTSSATGVKTVVLSNTGTTYSLPVMTGCLVALVILLLPKTGSEFALQRKQGMPTGTPSQANANDHHRDKERGWRVGHQGRDVMFYEELRDGTWMRIPIEGEMLMGQAHHVIYFASPQRWLKYPEWAHHRREEIIARIKSEFRPPDYLYEGDDATGSFSENVTPSYHEAETFASSHPPLPQPLPPRPPVATPNVSGGKSTSLVWVILVLFGLTATMGWFVYEGIQKGETSLPARHSSYRSTISRAEKPALFWTSIGIFSALGAGFFVLGIWCTVAGFRPDKDQRP